MRKTSITQNLLPDAWVNTIRYAIIAIISENLPPDAKTRASSRLKNLAKGRAQENAMVKLDRIFVTQRTFLHLPEFGLSHIGRQIIQAVVPAIVRVSCQRQIIKAVRQILKLKLNRGARRNQYWRPPNPWVRLVVPLRG